MRNTDDLFYEEDWYQRWLMDLVGWWCCWSFFSVVVSVGLVSWLESTRPIIESAS